MAQHYLKRSAGILVLLGLGLAVGAGLRAWLVPKLPTPIAHAFGVAASEEAKGTTGAEGRRIAFWKSSMIPNFVSPKPGLDPMGMELIPVYADELGEEKLIRLSHETVNNMGLRTAPVRRGKAERVVRTVGQVDYAEPLLGDVTLKVDGWVEQLLVDYVGQRVEKGQPLFTFYSPELVTAEEEYLVSLRPQPTLPDRYRRAGSDVIYSAYDKLRYWDVPDSEIEEVRRTGHAKKAVTFVSPYDGWVIEKHAYEGMHMKPGSRFYRIADLSTVWVYVVVYEFQLPWVREGQPARLTFPYLPGQTFDGKVIYVYPYVDPKSRQIRVRLEFPNPDLRLKPEMYADVEIETASEQAYFLVPQDAVIYTGQHREIDGVEQRVGYAYVQVGHGEFEPREVVMGEEVEGGGLQILSGLEEGEQVVVSGQFQLDSERKVKEANLRMLTQTGSQETGNVQRAAGGTPLQGVPHP